MNSSYAKFYKCLMTAQIPDGSKIVFCALLDFAALRAKPKIKTLAKATGKSSRRIERDLGWLRKAGLVQMRSHQIAKNWQDRIRQHVADSNPPACGGFKTGGPYNSQDFFSRLRSTDKKRKLAGITNISTRARAVAANAAPACQTTNGIDGIFQEAFRSVSAAGVELPPRYVRNEYGREERNPASARLDEVLRSRQEKILMARKPVALAQKIILDELQQA